MTEPTSPPKSLLELIRRREQEERRQRDEQKRADAAASLAFLERQEEGMRERGELARQVLAAALAWRRAARYAGLDRAGTVRWHGTDVSWVELPFRFSDPERERSWGTLSIRVYSPGFEVARLPIDAAEDLVHHTREDLERMLAYFRGSEAWEDLEHILLLREKR